MQKPNVVKSVGIGLRSCHYHHVINEKPPVAWFELLTDNYLMNHGIPLKKIDLIRENYPMTLHGVGLSLGSTDPLNEDYIGKIYELIERFKPAWISDHLCWSSINGEYLHDLLPLPYIKETLQHIGERIQRIQDRLPCPLLLENVSSYLTFDQNEMTEWEFLNAIFKKTGCKLLLDVNNIYVSAINHHFNPEDYLEGIDRNIVGEIHLAGYQKVDDLLVDTHGATVSQAVWQLYQKAIARFGRVPTLVEWDNDIPEFEVLIEQSLLAQKIMNHADT